MHKDDDKAVAADWFVVPRAVKLESAKRDFNDSDVDARDMRMGRWRRRCAC